MTPESVVHPVDIVTMIDVAKSAPAGAFVEVGVYKGGTAFFLEQIAIAQGRTLHLFDTFCGTPTALAFDKHKVGDFSDTSLARVRSACPTAKIYPGVFPDTLPPDLVDIAFVHVDCDQFESICASIQFLYPRLVDGGFLYFDDYPHIEAARMAVDRYFAKKELIQTKNGQVYARAGLDIPTFDLESDDVVVRNIGYVELTKQGFIMDNMNFTAFIIKGSAIDKLWRSHHRLGGDILGTVFKLVNDRYEAAEVHMESLKDLHNVRSVQLEAMAIAPPAPIGAFDSDPFDTVPFDTASSVKHEDLVIPAPKRRGRPTKSE